MKKFRRDTRGAVTIIVTMMLIPALLLSGTSVDLSRIYATRSIAHNANQLAANSALTQYDALLKDLYGLFGVAEEDPILGEMLNEYIQVAVLGQKKGEDWIDKGLGTFQMLQGSTATAKIIPAEKYNLGEPDILRRQIEEYMKFRGPVILVEQLLKSFEIFGSSIKVSSEAIDHQETVSNLMIEFCSLYINLYEAIVAADKCREVGGNPNLGGRVGNISKSLGFIREYFVRAKELSEEWEEICEEIENVENELDSARDADPQDDVLISVLEERLDSLKSRKTACEESYKSMLEHIEALAVGGGGGGLKGIKAQIEDTRTDAIKFKENFQKVSQIAADLDSKREDIRAEINTLQQKINDPDCDPLLKTKMQDIIDGCNKLLDQFQNIEDMAKTYQINGDNYIDNIFIPAPKGIEGIGYRTHGTYSGGLSLDELGSISSTLSIGGGGAATYAGYSDVEYSMPDGFKEFADFGGKHMELYNLLDKMAKESKDIGNIEIDTLKDDSGSKDFEKRQKSIIKQLRDLAKNAKDGLANNPLGAERVEDSTVQNAWPREFNMGSGIIEMLSNPSGAIQDMADFALVLTYGTGMFSNYTTGKPAELGGSGGNKKTPPTKSITSVPMDAKVNYFYQSEWEYLLIGDKSADKNLSAVKDLIYNIRRVCNGIAVFSVDEVMDIANAVLDAGLAVPFIGPALGPSLFFLTIVAFEEAESAYDVMKLRNGCKVPLVKIGGKEWVMKPSGIVEELVNLGKDDDISVEPAADHDKEKGISYEQYMLSFFIVDALTYGKSIETLVNRMGNLIEWNVINYKFNANAGNLDGNGKVNTDAAVSAMSTAFAQPDCFRLAKRHTDFDVTTTINMRLYFLTMPLFQNQGSPFTNELVISETDYRGY